MFCSEPVAAAGNGFAAKVPCPNVERSGTDFTAGVKPTGPQWPARTGPPSLTLRRVSASGTAASEISISTQNAST
jgi:hypothetical protein